MSSVKHLAFRVYAANNQTKSNKVVISELSDNSLIRTCRILSVTAFHAGRDDRFDSPPRETAAVARFLEFASLSVATALIPLYDKSSAGYIYYNNSEGTTISLSLIADSEELDIIGFDFDVKVVVLFQACKSLLPPPSPPPPPPPPRSTDITKVITVTIPMGWGVVDDKWTFVTGSGISEDFFPPQESYAFIRPARFALSPQSERLIHAMLGGGGGNPNIAFALNTGVGVEMNGGDGGCACFLAPLAPTVIDPEYANSGWHGFYSSYSMVSAKLITSSYLQSKLESPSTQSIYTRINKVESFNDLSATVSFVVVVVAAAAAAAS